MLYHFRNKLTTYLLYMNVHCTEKFFHGILEPEALSVLWITLPLGLKHDEYHVCYLFAVIFNFSSSYMWEKMGVLS
jgi:hypothetical protein